MWFYYQEKKSATVDSWRVPESPGGHGWDMTWQLVRATRWRPPVVRKLVDNPHENYIDITPQSTHGLCWFFNFKQLVPVYPQNE